MTLDSQGAMELQRSQGDTRCSVWRQGSTQGPLELHKDTGVYLGHRSAQWSQRLLEITLRAQIRRSNAWLQHFAI